MNALEVKNINKAYPTFQLDNISFCLPEGCILGLIGENGAGKSTTIKLILDAIHPDSGEITVLGKDNKIDFETTKEDLGVVLDEAHFPESITVKEVDVIMRHTYRRWDSNTYFTHIKKLGLPEKKQFKEFSRGMKMKLAIAVALSHDAKLLILDEATSGLDPIARDEILDLFYQFTREETHSILISSHIITDLEKLCDYIAFIHEGKLLFFEEKDRLLEKYGILKCGKEAFSEIPPAAIKRSRITNYGVEALVERERLSPTLPIERAGIEDIIVFLAKEDRDS